MIKPILVALTGVSCIFANLADASHPPGEPSATPCSSRAQAMVTWLQARADFEYDVDQEIVTEGRGEERGKCIEAVEGVSWTPGFLLAFF